MNGDETPQPAWEMGILRPHTDVVRRAVDEALKAERDRREGVAFMRGCLVGLVAGFLLWLCVLAALVW